MHEHSEMKRSACQLIKIVCNTLQEQNRLDKAYSLAKQLVVAAPEYEDSWLVMGNLCKQAGDLDKALEIYKQGIHAAQEP